MPWNGSTPLAEEAEGGPTPYDESNWDSWDGLTVIYGRRV
jgi:hypothetical protein